MTWWYLAALGSRRHRKLDATGMTGRQNRCYRVGMKAASVSWFLGWSNKGMGSKAYNPRPIPVQLSFDGHGGHRQIIVGVEDAVSGTLLADMARAGTQPPPLSLIAYRFAGSRQDVVDVVVYPCSCGLIEFPTRMTEFSLGASKAKGTGSRSRTRSYAPWR